MTGRRILATLAAVVAVVLTFGTLSPFSFCDENTASTWFRGWCSMLSPNQPPADRHIFTCKSHTYSTEILSVDPLVIYIHDFISSHEVSSLLETGEPLFGPSLLTGKDGQVRQSQRRTSQTAQMQIDDPVVRCVLERASGFMGSMLSLPYDDFQPPQLVRYSEKQQFKVHADWFDEPQSRRADSSGIGSSWNRPATFLAILEDNCTAGETWFPHIHIPKKAVAKRTESPPWRLHEQDGLAVKPIRGNALFWVNLFANGTGDDRTRHAGLPPTSGVKTALNIWPRVYYS
ncbi:hypothetical protein CkaCkLH20_04276 [Colletotrichum karsti]|uniref:Prolyl 4-hydroxylase alpha subunit domain-containing protein n=1 Tax=Colletotrichum karsti TaxID=1095194 RepID=A0A9P6I8C5_9PEZI|nr:uncharacterized protein CkaCkLH20_04276 [Colletotrichum karsti]KAF9878238.1 hypothetical protein CkaCkLH20_04276 [Colletotrichum karsti]